MKAAFDSKVCWGKSGCRPTRIEHAVAPVVASSTGASMHEVSSSEASGGEQEVWPSRFRQAGSVTRCLRGPSGGRSAQWMPKAVQAQLLYAPNKAAMPLQSHVRRTRRGQLTTTLASGGRTRASLLAQGHFRQGEEESTASGPSVSDNGPLQKDAYFASPPPGQIAQTA